MEYEVAQRKKEGVLLREATNKKDWEIFNPIDADINAGEGVAPHSTEIFSIDIKAIDEADVFFFDMGNKDSGTIMEMGIAIEKLRQGKEIKIYAVDSDFRMGHSLGTGWESPLGYNEFVIGAIKGTKQHLFNSFGAALEQFKKDFNLND